MMSRGNNVPVVSACTLATAFVIYNGAAAKHRCQEVDSISLTLSSPSAISLLVHRNLRSRRSSCVQSGWNRMTHRAHGHLDP